MPAFQASPTWSALFWGAYIFWAFSELIIFRRDRRRVAGRSEDGGSLFVLIGTIVLAIFAAFGLARVPAGLIAAPPAAIEVPALALMAGGVCLRIWAVATLGTYFRVTVTAQTGHRLIEAGPYRLLRHPAYTGALMTATGVGLAMGNWLSLAAACGLALAGFVWRIRVEERSLRGLFGSAYDAFARRRWALVPGVW